MAGTPPVAPPPRLARARRHDAGAWLADLPELAGEVAERWGLTVERVVEPGGLRGLTVLVRLADGSPAALTLRPPGPVVRWEARALARWRGHGAVRLLREDGLARGALLVERADSATSLRSLPAAQAMLEAASTVRRLWVPVAGAEGPAEFRSVAELTGEQAEMMRRAAVGRPEAAPLVEEALGSRAALLADPAAEQVLLHGDFRQDAVLASAADRARWLAVGPEPVTGERAYDVARLVRDRLHDLMASPGAAAITRRRLATLSDALEVDGERLRAWTLFRAVASAAGQLAVGRGADAEPLLEFAAWL